MTMITEIADPDTLFLGEVFAGVDTDGDGTYDSFDNRVSTPHLWAATLVYLTLMAYYHPELFDPHEALLPAAEIPDEVEPPEVDPDGGPDGGADAGPDGGEDAGPPRTAAGGTCDCEAAGRITVGNWARLLLF